jgi:hypothetical protein
VRVRRSPPTKLWLCLQCTQKCLGGRTDVNRRSNLALRIASPADVTLMAPLPMTI